MNKFAQYLQGVTVGPAVPSANLAMYPLFRHAGLGNDDFDAGEYLGFDEALKENWVTVTELDEQGSVPTLLLDNSAPKPVLLLDGEQLVGAKQNRTVNLTLLIAAGAKTEIPVSCVEAGRWSRRSQRFRNSDYMHFNRGRREKVEQVNRNMRRHRSRAADQGEVWRSIDEKQDALAAESPTSAMDDVYARSRRRLGDYESDLIQVPGQTGAVFAINGEISGFDLFANPGHFSRYLPKLIRSHALDALETASEPVGKAVALPPADEIAAFLKGFSRANEEAYDAIGLGQDIRVETPDRVGAGLAWQGAPVHLAGFPKTLQTE